MLIEIRNKLFLSRLPYNLADKIKTKLTMANPAFAEAQKMDRWTGNIPRELRFYEKHDNGLAVPRGFLQTLNFMAAGEGERIEIIDKRRTLPEIVFDFSGELRGYQEDAVNATAALDESSLCAPTGSGKTVMALAIIAERQQPALIIVHTRELLKQWIDRIETFLNIPAYDIGVIGGGKKVIGEKITVAIVNSLYPIAQDIRHHFGHVIVDECHRAPARMFTEALAAFDARYILGLSATPFRRDGMSSAIFWHCGPLAHKINQADLEMTGDIVKADVILRHTGFHPSADPASQYSKALAELTEDYHRNALIARDVATEAAIGGGICLILTDRKKHAEALKDLISRHNVKADVLTGESSARERSEIVERLNRGDIEILIATGQLIGEGFDCKGLSTLFLATPISYQGRVIQYLGRVLRPAPGKKRALVFDYIDQDGVLRASAQKRQEIYNRNKWSIFYEKKNIAA